MEDKKRDNVEINYQLAQRVLPAPLLEVMESIFEVNIDGMGLVGGTALAGFYYGHRRSDDIDIFVRDRIVKSHLERRIKNLEGSNGIDLYVLEQSNSSDFFHANCQYLNHNFTIDIVVDPHLFTIGNTVSASDESHIVIFDLQTIMKMKIATLVSRCSEKDLYDLLHIFNNYSKLTIGKLIKFGREVDGGVRGESLLASIGGSHLRIDACDFVIDQPKSAQQVHVEITNFQHDLIVLFDRYLSNDFGDDEAIVKHIRMLRKMS